MPSFEQAYCWKHALQRNAKTFADYMVLCNHTVTAALMSAQWFGRLPSRLFIAVEHSIIAGNQGKPHKKRQFEDGPPRNSGNQRQTNYASE